MSKPLKIDMPTKIKALYYEENIIPVDKKDSIKKNYKPVESLKGKSFKTEVNFIIYNNE